MNVLAAAAVVAISAGVAIAALLLVRRRAPDGGFYNDGDRAAGVFGVLATGFAVLLGLVVVLAFTSYDESRAGAETEAITVAQQYEVANLLPQEQGRRLAGELVCYARSVVHDEWPRMRAGTQTAEANPWGLQLYRTLRTVEPRTAAEQAAYAKWLDQRLDRESARNDAPARGVGRDPGAAVARARRQRGDDRRLHAGLRRQRRARGGPGDVRGRVVVVIVATLLLIRFLDDPYDPGLGALQPVAMERTLDVLDEYRRVVGDETPLPCDRLGRPQT